MYIQQQIAFFSGSEDKRQQQTSSRSETLDCGSLAVGAKHIETMKQVRDSKSLFKTTLKNWIESLRNFSWIVLRQLKCIRCVPMNWFWPVHCKHFSDDHQFLLRNLLIKKKNIEIKLQRNCSWSNQLMKLTTNDEPISLIQL